MRLPNSARTTCGAPAPPSCMKPATTPTGLRKLAHEQKGVRAVYNKAEYREQRKAMLQDWANMIDSWTSAL